MQALLALDSDVKTQDWGQEGVVRLVSMLRNSDEVQFKVPSEIQSAVDRWLAVQLVSPASDLEKMLEMAAQAGGPNSVHGELARYLTREAVQNPFNRSEEPFVPDCAWLERIGAHADSGVIVRRFVSELLGRGRNEYHADFSSHLVALAGDLTFEFVSAAAHVVEAGSIPSPASVVFGPALQDLDLARSVTCVALRLAKTFEHDEQQSLAIENGHYSEGYVETYSSANAESWSPIADWLEGYVAQLRAVRGWKTLDEDPLSDELLPWWLDAVCVKDATPAPDRAELERLLERAYGTRHEEKLWTATSAHWSEVFRPALEQRLADGERDAGVQTAAVKCLLQASSSSLEGVVGRLVSEGQSTRLFELFCVIDLITHEGEIADEDERYFAASYLDSLRTWRAQAAQGISALPQPLQAVIRLLFSKHGARDAAGEPEMNLLRDLRCEGDIAELARLELLAENGCITSEDVRSFLARVGDGVRAGRAVELAEAAGLADEVNGALRHRFAKARAAAVAAQTMDAERPLSPSVLHLCGDESRFVKNALLDALEQEFHQAHAPVLVALCADVLTQ